MERWRSGKLKQVFWKMISNMEDQDVGLEPGRNLKSGAGRRNKRNV